jgi:hypothetical protein
MKVTSLSWLLLAVASFVAVADGPADTDRSDLNQLMLGLTALMAVDLGNCEYEYADFAAGYQALIDSRASKQLARLADHHGIEVKAPENVEHNPTHAQCMDALGKAKAMFAANARLIGRLSATLPEADESEEP